MTPSPFADARSQLLAREGLRLLARREARDQTPHQRSACAGRASRHHYDSRLERTREWVRVQAIPRVRVSERNETTLLLQKSMFMYVFTLPLGTKLLISELLQESCDAFRRDAKARDA